MKKIVTARWLSFLLLPVSVTALPQGEQVTHGNAEFHLDGSSYSISTSDKTVISYDSFNVGKLEHVRFIQPSKNATVLNRVIGSDPSQIFGRVSSNGKVFLVNPQGVYFGKEAIVDTGSLIVSTLDILDQDFLEDRFSFYTKEGFLPGFIHNEGTLIASNGVSALISPQIKNEGIIRANLSKVLLAGSEAVTLTFTGDGLMSFEIENTTKEGLIEHFGSIEANEVFIRLAQAKEAIEHVINLDGLIDGNTLIQENGKIRISHQSSLKASQIFIEGSNVSVEGEIDVSSATAGTTGGTLHILGDHIELLGAKVDASGDSGGGTVLIGGEYKGQDGIRTALTNHMDADSTIEANALTEGNGGRVILWADDSTRFNGTISVKGGEISGDGGFVETSGKERLGALTGRVNALAPHGKAGTWLLDPLTITIVAGSAGTIGTGVGAVGDCTDTTSNPYNIGIVTINSSSANVLLCASSTSGGAINQNGQVINITTSGIGIQFQGSNSAATPLDLNANITTNGGAVTFTNVNVGLLTDVSIDTTNSGGAAGANVTFDNTSGIDGAQALTITAGTGTLALNASVGRATPPTNLAIQSAALIQLGADITLTGDNPLVFPSPVNLTNNSIVTSFASPNTGANITFSSPINGAQNLDVEAGSGSLVFSSSVGGITPLSSLTAISTNTASPSFTGIIVTATGAVSLKGYFDVSDTAFVTTTGGTITVAGYLGGGCSLSTTNGGLFPVGGDINFLANFDNTNSFTLQGGTGGIITFASGVTGTSRVQSLTVVGGTIIQNSRMFIGGNIGLSYTATNSIQITGNVVTNGGPISMMGPILLTGSVTFDATNGGNRSTGAAVTFSGSTTTLNFATVSNTLNLNAGSAGIITIGGAIGGSTPPATLGVQNTILVQIGANITVTGANPITISRPMSITGTCVMTSNNANINLSNTINGGNSLTLTAGTGNISLGAAIGATTALTSLSATVTGAGTITQSSTVRTSTGNVTYSSAAAISIGGNITTTSNGAISVTGPVALTGPVTMSTVTGGGGNISFVSSTSTVNGGNSLILTAGTGSISLGGTVGATTALTSLSATVTGAGTITQSSTVRTSTGNVTYSSAAAISIGGNITTTTNGAISITGPVTLTGTTAMSTATGGGANISFVSSTSTIDGAVDLSLAAGTGTISLGGAVGGVTPLTDLVFTSAASIQIGSNITVTGAHALSFPNPVSLIGSSNITNTNNNISFASTIDGANTLALSAGTGAISFSSAVGSTTALTSLSATVTGAGTITQSSTVRTSTGNVTYSSAAAIPIGGNITTTSNGAISITGPVALTGPITMSTVTGGGGNISFVSSTSTVDGGNSLILTAGTGSISLGGAVGGITALTSLSATVTGAGTITQSNTVRTSGNITYSSAATISIGDNITTTSNGAISITGPVTLTGTTAMSTATGGGANISFVSSTSTIDGAVDLSLAAGTGTISLEGSVGGMAPLTDLIFTSATSIQIGSNITVTGAHALSFPNPVILTGSSNITNTNNNISFASTINGANALVLTAGTGVISFSSAVGGTTALTSLSATVTGAGTITQSNTVRTSTGNVTYSSAAAISIGANITTTSNGAISITGPVALTSPVTMSTVTGGGGNISFVSTTSTVDGGNSLILTAGTGSISLGGAVGGITALTSLSATVTGAGTITQSNTVRTSGNITYSSAADISIGGNITTTSNGAISITGPVALTGAVTMSTATGGGANISFVSSTSTVDGGNSLTLTAGTGNISLEGAVGGITALTSLSATVTGAGTITQSSTVRTSTGNVTYSSAAAIPISGNITTTSNGAISITGPVALTGPVTMSTATGGGANISFVSSTSTINGSQALTLTAGIGNISLDGAVGATTPLTSLSASGAAITQSSTLNTSGAVTYSNTGLLTIGGTLTIGPLTQFGGGTVLLGANIVSSNTLHFADPVNFNTTTSLSAIGIGGLIFDSPFIPTIDSAFNLTFSVIAGTLSAPQLGSPSKYINTLTIEAQTINVPPLLIYAHTFNQNVGNVISADITSPGGNLFFLSATTVTAGTFTIDVTGGISAGSALFASTLDGVGGLIFDMGDGDLIFSEAIGSITPFGSLTITSANDVSVNDGFTGDSFVQEAGTGTTTLEGTITTTTSTGVSLNASIDLASAVTINTTVGNGDITFGSSSIDGGESLTLEAGSGTISLLGPVGASTPLTNLIFGSAGLVKIGSNITVTGANPLIFPDPVRIIAPSIITSNNADVTFESTLDGGVDPTIDAGTGTVTFLGPIGSITPIADLTVIAGIINQNSSLISSGPVTYINSGLATISGAISADSFTQSGGGSTLLEAGMNVASSIHLTDLVNFSTSLSLIAGGSGGIIFESPIIPTSTRIYNLTLSAKNGSVIGPQLGSPTEYINKLIIRAKFINVPLIYANILIEIIPIHPFFEYIPGIYTNYWKQKDTLSSPWYFDPGFITEQMVVPQKRFIWAL